MAETDDALFPVYASWNSYCCRGSKSDSVAIFVSYLLKFPTTFHESNAIIDYISRARYLTMNQMLRNQEH